MRHNRRTKRFQRSAKERKALLESLVMSLLKHQQIRTTLQKAKEAKRLADHMITLGKDDTLASRRQAFSYLQDHSLTSKLFKEVAPRFKARNGGYTRILQLNRRKGDGAQLALLELTEKEIIVREPKKAKKEAKGKAEAHAHGHDHSHDKPAKTGEAHAKPESKKEPKKAGFFNNLGKFFRNKGGS